jgi:hypothetical protein
VRWIIPRFGHGVALGFTLAFGLTLDFRFTFGHRKVFGLPLDFGLRFVRGALFMFFHELVLILLFRITFERLLW